MAGNTNYKRVSNKQAQSTNSKKPLSNSQSAGASTSLPKGEHFTRADALRLISDVRAGGEKRRHALKELSQKTEDEEVEKVFAEQKFAKELTHLLKEKDLDMKQDAVCILVDLTCNNDAFKQQVWEADGVRALLREIRQNTEDNYVDYCLRALVSIAAGNDDMKSEIVQLGGVRLLLKVLKNESSPWGVRAWAAGLLGDLMDGSTGKKVSREVAESDVVGLLAELIQQDDNECVQCGAVALNNLMNRYSTARMEAVDTPGLSERLMGAIGEKKYNCVTRCQCVSALLEMCLESPEVFGQSRDSLRTEAIKLQKEVKNDRELSDDFRNLLNHLIETLRS